MGEIDRAASAPAEAIISLNASSHHGADLYAVHVANEERSRHDPLEIGTFPHHTDPCKGDTRTTTGTSPHSAWNYIKSFPSKLKGGQDTPLSIPSALDIFWSGLGAFCSILLLSGLTQWLEPAFNLPLLYASFGASAVLVFGVISSPLAQPRNLIGGQVLSAVVGCAIRLALKDVLWVSAALGMSLALVVMMLTKTVHPPGGATALIAATANPVRPWQGFQFVVCIFIGSFGMLLVALVFNNLHVRKRYPMFW